MRDTLSAHDDLALIENTQSVAEFRAAANATIERANRINQVELITAGGEPRAVLLSPNVYSAMAKEDWLSRDIEAIRKSMKEIDEGKSQEGSVFFEELRARLLALKARQEQGKAK